MSGVRCERADSFKSVGMFLYHGAALMHIRISPVVLACV